MVQEQLVDYISSQMKLGVSRDAIKAALVSAGWVAMDVDDTLKKVDAGSSGVASAGGVAMAGGVQSSSMQGQPTVTKTATIGSSSAVKSAEPQMIRVSDLVSASPAAGVAASNSSASVINSSSLGTKPAKDAFFNGKISGNTFQASPASGAVSSSSGGKKTMVGGIVAVVLILLFAGLSWYFYAGSAGLSSQVKSLTAQSASVTAQLNALQSQMDASSTGLTAQIASLTAANNDLALNLSFYAAPIGGASSTTGTSLPVTISGWLAGGTKYSITTPRGAKIFIVNSSAMLSQLKPLIGDTVQLDGTYIPGSDEITVNSVTDLSPAAATSTTATTTTTTAFSSPVMTTSSTASSTTGN